MIGKRAEDVLNRAVRNAYERRHEYFTLEHVLMSLLDEAEILEIVQACGGSFTELKKELEDYLDRDVPKSSRNATEAGASGGAGDSAEEILEHPVATLGVQRMIQRALFHVQSAGKDEIRPEDLFVAIFQAKDSYALHLLSKQRIERLDVIHYLSHGVTTSDAPSPPAPVTPGATPVRSGEPGAARGGSGPTPARSGDGLDAYTDNLNAKARAGKIDPLIGRQNELERMIQTLSRRRKNNPLLVGEAGVGKTALAEGLATRIVAGQVPSLLRQAEVYALDMGSLLAGAKYRGDFEQRLKKVLKALEGRKAAGFLPILVIDEIHTIIGAGAVSGGALDAANLLKPVLSGGEIRCIGSTTYQEYRNIFEKDHALARRFQKIDVPEPSQEETIQILGGLRGRFEEHHRVLYTAEAIRSAVELSTKHLTDRFLPDKAIDVLDEAGARARIEQEARESKDSTAPSTAPVVVDAPQIEEIISKIARIPARSVSTAQKGRLANLERDLRLTIFGQDHAVGALGTAIRLARSGLRSGDRPVGSFLFCGPTGVGKTELAKQLAHCMGVPFLRFDMSEYMEKHTVSRLIGAPPGYVGFEQAGLLTDAVMKNPHAVILLDEIEKAHPDVWNILLQVMDHGTLTDNNGKKADFRNSILIMTSNVGAREMERRPVGMSASHEAGSAAQAKTASARKEVERAFSPEFRNRLDSIVYFNALDPVTIGQIVGKQLLELESLLLAKSVELEVSPEVREWLAQKGFDSVMGARPMARLIQEKVKNPLSQEILFGKLEHGGKVTLSLEGGELRFDYAESDRFKKDALPALAPPRDDPGTLSE